MRQLSPSQLAAFQGGLLTIASLVTIFQNDGVTVKLTDHIGNLDDFKCAFGVELSAITTQLGGGGQTCTATFLPDRGEGGGVTYAALESGALDGCRITVALADYTADPLEPLTICTGFITDAKYGNADVIVVTLNTPITFAEQLCGDTMSQTCRADFGDAKCGIDITNMVDGPHVFAPIDAQSFVMTRDEVTPTGYYNNGTCYFKTGANKGQGYEILTVSDADAFGRETIYLKVPLAHDVVKGDYYLLYPGCDKVITSGCTYWQNVFNFQGEPFIADQSNILPPQSALTVKASGINTGLPADINWWLTQYIKIAYNKTILFTPGTRITANNRVSAGNNVRVFFNDYMIPQDAYTAIYNLLGGQDNVVAYDGTIQPKDAAAQAALTANNFEQKLNLNVSPILIDDAGFADQNERALVGYFYIDPSKVDPKYAPVPPVVQGAGGTV